MNSNNVTYVFGRIGRSNTVHMFSKAEGYNPSCICGSNGWKHSKKSDANLTEKDVTCKKCLARLATMQHLGIPLDNQPQAQSAAPIAETVQVPVPTCHNCGKPITEAHSEWKGYIYCNYQCVTDFEERNAALEGDLYELVGLGLASPDLLKTPRETLETELAAAQERIEKLETMIRKAIAKNDFLSPLQAMALLSALQRDFDSSENEAQS